MVKDPLDMFLEEEAQETGFLGAIPRGPYPIKVEDIDDIRASERTGSLGVSLRLRVLEGEQADRLAFVQVWLANPWKDTDSEEAEKRLRKFIGMSKGYAKALGVDVQKINYAQYDDHAEALKALYNIAAWIDCKAIADIDVETAEQQRASRLAQCTTPAEREDLLAQLASVNIRDRNRLAGFHSWDGKRGYASWKSQSGASSASTNTPSKVDALI